MCGGALPQMSSLTCIHEVPTLFRAPFQTPGQAKLSQPWGAQPGPEALQDFPGPGCGSGGKRDSRGRPTVQGAQGTEGPQGAWDAGVP